MKYLIEEELTIDNRIYQFKISENYRATLLITDLDNHFKSSSNSNIDCFIECFADEFKELPYQVLNMCRRYCDQMRIFL